MRLMSPIIMVQNRGHRIAVHGRLVAVCSRRGPSRCEFFILPQTNF